MILDEDKELTVVSEDQRSPATSQRLPHFWDQWIQTNVLPDHSENIRRCERVLELLGSLGLSNPDILDVGCANGWMSGRLVSLGRVTGMDFAVGAIAEAKIRYPNVTFICEDFLSCDLSARQFDVVVSVGVLQGVRDQRLFVDRLAFVLRPGGYLILISGNKLVWNRTSSGAQLPPDIPHNFLYMTDLKDLISKRFVVRHSETIIPGGDLGFLRLINSRKLTKVFDTLVGSGPFSRMKERAGLGKSLVVLAQKRG